MVNTDMGLVGGCRDPYPTMCVGALFTCFIRLVRSVVSSGPFVTTVLDELIVNIFCSGVFADTCYENLHFCEKVATK